MSDDEKRAEPREWDEVLDDLGDKFEQDLEDGRVGRRMIAYIRDEVLPTFKTEFDAIAKRMEQDEIKIDELKEEVEETRALEVEDIDRALVAGSLLGPRFEARDAASFISEIADALRGPSGELAEKLDEVSRVIGGC